MQDAEANADCFRQGREQGRREGAAESAVSTKMTDLLKVLAARDLRPTKKQLSRVAACTDPVTLGRWFDRSLTAARAAEVFAD